MRQGWHRRKEWEIANVEGAIEWRNSGWDHSEIVKNKYDRIVMRKGRKDEGTVQFSDR